ncbi:restriction endonuclease subunit S [Colwellia sp. E150_009]
MVELQDIFNVINGIAATGLKEKDQPFEGSIAYIRPASTQARTFRSYISKDSVLEEKLFPEETLFVSTNGEGSHSYSYVSTCEFVPNSDVSVLIPKYDLTIEEKLFYAQCITANRYLFSYGRKPKGNKLKTLKIPHINNFPDWVNDVCLSTFTDVPVKKSSKNPLNYINDWKEFALEELFDFKKGKRLTKANMLEGNTPFIGSTDSNNGVTNTVGQDAIHDGNVISVNYNGSVGEAFYQPVDFWASDDVNVLYPKEDCFSRFNSYIALFIIPIIRLNKFKFSYGRKWHMDRMKESQIVLPVKDGQLDLKVMEDFVKSLPYSTNI